MPIPTPTKEPARIVAGDRVTWMREIADYPAPGWKLKYHFRDQSGTWTVESVASDTDHLIDLWPMQTQGITPGVYSWSLVALSADQSDRRAIGAGTLVVEPDPGSDLLWDTRQHDQYLVDLIEAALEGRIPLDTSAPLINGKPCIDHSLEDLRSILSECRRRIALREERRRNPSPMRTITPRFS